MPPSPRTSKFIFQRVRLISLSFSVCFFFFLSIPDSNRILYHVIFHRGRSIVCVAGFMNRDS